MFFLKRFFLTLQKDAVFIPRITTLSSDAEGIRNAVFVACEERRAATACLEHPVKFPAYLITLPAPAPRIPSLPAAFPVPPKENTRRKTPDRHPLVTQGNREEAVEDRHDLETER